MSAAGLSTWWPGGATTTVDRLATAKAEALHSFAQARYEILQILHTPSPCLQQQMTFCATWASVAEGPRGRADVPGEAPNRCQQMRREAVGGGRVWNVSHASWRRRALNAYAVTPDTGIGRLGELWIAQTTASGSSVSVSVSGDGSPRLAGRRRAGRG